MTVKDREKSRKHYAIRRRAVLRLTGGNLELVCVCEAEKHSPYPPPLCVQRWGEKENMESIQRPQAYNQSTFDMDNSFFKLQI